MVAPGQCAGCGHDLGGLEGEVAERVQVSDTPPVRLRVTEYQMVKVACPACRTVTRAATRWVWPGRAVTARTCGRRRRCWPATGI